MRLLDAPSLGALIDVRQRCDGGPDEKPGGGACGNLTRRLDELTEVPGVWVVRCDWCDTTERMRVGS